MSVMDNNKNFGGEEMHPTPIKTGVSNSESPVRGGGGCQSCVAVASCVAEHDSRVGEVNIWADGTKWSIDT